MSERNIRLLVEYDGTRYHGWQRQLNSVSVQETLEDALYRLTGAEIKTVASGRTDAGVHARGQVVNFKVDHRMAADTFLKGANAYLPPDIRVKQAEEAPAGFNARFDAKKRTYQYYLTLERTAIFRDFCWQFFGKIDGSLLAPMAELLIGNHDFGAFSRLEVQSEHKRCIVYQSEWRREGIFRIYRITANRFLHGMVRSIVGTMIDVARGRFTPEQFETIFLSCDRTKAGAAAPPGGLFLEEVLYSENEES